MRGGERRVREREGEGEGEGGEINGCTKYSMAFVGGDSIAHLLLCALYPDSITPHRNKHTHTHTHTLCV